jgi:hypothetical protein
MLNALRSLGASGQPLRYRLLARAIVLSICLWMLVPIADRLWNPYAFDNSSPSFEFSIPRQIQRATLESHLNQLPGQHLILVHYRAHDVADQDWIYNRADIDASKIVWARDMGRDANQELLRYYPNRQVWYVDRGSSPLLVPYAAFLTMTAPANIRNQ